MGPMIKNLSLYFLTVISFTSIALAMEPIIKPPIRSTNDLLNRVPQISYRLYNNVESYNREQWDKWLKQDRQWGACKISSQQLRATYGHLQVIEKNPRIQQNPLSHTKIKQWMQNIKKITDVKGVRPSTTDLSIKERLNFATGRSFLGIEAFKSCDPAHIPEAEKIETQINDTWAYFLTPSAWKRPTISHTFGVPSPAKPIVRGKPKRRRVKRKLGPPSPGQKRISEYFRAPTTSEEPRPRIKRKSSRQSSLFEYFQQSDDDSDKENHLPTK